MTRLNIRVDHDKKTLVPEGRIAVGEDVAVTLDMGAEVEDLNQLRLRFRHLGSDVAVYPISVGDEWSEAEIGAGDGVYTCMLNLETEELRALFTNAPERASLMLDMIVDQVSDEDETDDYQTLYGRGRVKVYNWMPDLTATDIHEGRKPKTLFHALDGKVNKVQTSGAGNIVVFETLAEEGNIKRGIADANISIDNGGAPLINGASLPTVSKVGSIVSESLSPISTAVVNLQAAVQQKADATALSGKVDVKDGKELSSNDFTDALKAKLDGIESGAEKNVGIEFTQAEKDKLADIEDEATKVIVDEEFDNQSGNAISNARVTAFHEGYHTFKNLVEGTYLPAKADLENGKVPVSQLPSFVSDVKEYPSAADFPEEGEAAKIYVAKDTNLTYRWSGTGYVEISQSLALGETASTAYPGNKGKANADAIAAMKDGTSIDSFGDVETALAGKQATISDLADIRAGAAAIAAAVQSVNGMTPTVGAVTITGDDVLYRAGENYSLADAYDNLALQMSYKANAADLRYAQGMTITASAQLADRTANRVVPLASNTDDVELLFPDGVMGHALDFLVLVTNTVGNTGNITFALPPGMVVYGDGFTHSPASGETWLYSVTEVASNTFWVKSVKMEVAQ